MMFLMLWELVQPLLRHLVSFVSQKLMRHACSLTDNGILVYNIFSQFVDPQIISILQYIILLF